MHDDSATEEIPAVREAGDAGETAEWDASYFTLVPPREAVPVPVPGRRRRRRRGRVVPLALLGCVVAAGVLGWVLVGTGGESGRVPQAAEPVTDSPAASASSTPAGSASGPASAASSPSPRASVTSAGPPSSSPRASAGATSAAASAAVAATLRAGDSGAAVTRLQQLLFRQGFTYVQVTGVYDKTTVRGVRQFQRDRGLTTDPAGVYGPATRAALEG